MPGYLIDSELRKNFSGIRSFLWTACVLSGLCALFFSQGFADKALASQAASFSNESWELLHLQHTQGEILDRLHWESLFEPDFLADDPDLSKTRDFLQTIETEFPIFEDAYTRAIKSVAPEVVRIQAQKASMALAAQQRERLIINSTLQVLQSDRNRLGLYREMYAFMERAAGKWSVADGAVVFANNDDMLMFTAIMEKIAAAKKEKEAAVLNAKAVLEAGDRKPEP